MLYFASSATPARAVAAIAAADWYTIAGNVDIYVDD
jgi:hypothetical protein